MADFAVVIPACNEAGTIRDVVLRALEVTARVIVVDDFSQDGTGEALRDLPISLLVNDKRLGKGASLWRGAQQAMAMGAGAVVTLDGDGQHRPEDIPRLIAAFELGPQRVVIGARQTSRALTPAARYIANKIANFWISWACGQRLTDSQSGFRVYPAELFRILSIPLSRKRSFVFESEMLIEAARNGYSCFAVTVPAVYHSSGRPSHYRHVDTFYITLMVAGKLLQRGLDLGGFYRAFLRPR